MEPQIGIRGRSPANADYWSVYWVSMEPQIGIRGREPRTRKWAKKLSAASFNGAPDRNPGKGDAALRTASARHVEFQWSPR